jgi:hypothetical protein
MRSFVLLSAAKINNSLREDGTDNYGYAVMRNCSVISQVVDRVAT